MEEDPIALFNQWAYLLEEDAIDWGAKDHGFKMHFFKVQLFELHYFLGAAFSNNSTFKRWKNKLYQMSSKKRSFKASVINRL